MKTLSAATITCAPSISTTFSSLARKGLTLTATSRLVTLFPVVVVFLGVKKLLAVRVSLSSYFSLVTTSSIASFSSTITSLIALLV